jgi:hypothetical protein
MSLISFKDNNQLMCFAEKFLVKDRLNSLEYDINRCLAYDEKGFYSPLPALMYCFSMIDLLGALYSGNAKSSSKTTKNSMNYMTTFMKYSKDMVDLLQKVYRHKTVHLSAPKTAIKYKGHIISWSLDDTNPQNHLSIDYSESGSIDLFNCGKISYVGKLIVNINVLKDDIKDSVIRKNDSYLARLQIDLDLQGKFLRAVNEMYDIPIICQTKCSSTEV